MILRRTRPAALLLALAFAAPLVPAAHAVPHHPLEDRALSEPEAVLRELPMQIEAARKQGRVDEPARLFLAPANACRVIADWPCQRVACAAARADD